MNKMVLIVCVYAKGELHVAPETKFGLYMDIFSSI